MKSSKNKINKADILLTVCPPFDPGMPPLCLGYLEAYLKSRGFQAVIYDVNIEVYNNVDANLKSFWQLEISHSWSHKNLFKEIYTKEQQEELVDKVLKFDTPLVGFSVNTANRPTTIELMQAIKKRDKEKIIIVGGMGCFYEEERKFFPEGLVDIFVIGEGEETLLEIIQKLKKGESLRGVAGVVLKGREKQYIQRSLIADLDGIPYPDAKQFTLDDYATDMIALLSSRGCINRCAFCSDYPFWRGKYRSRSAKHIFAEIKYNVVHLKKERFMFYDLLLNGNVKELEKLTELLIKWDRKISWMGDMLVRPKVSEELFVKMKEAGCFALCWGIESGSNKVLKLMRKSFKAEDAEKNLKQAKKAGILNYLNIIAGFPGEHEEDFKETLSFLERNSLNIDGLNNINSCNIVAHTYLFDNYQKYGVTRGNRSDNWSCSNNNTTAVRKQRIFKVKELLTKLDKKIYSDNVQYVDEDFTKNYLGNYNPLALKNKDMDILLINAPYASADRPDLRTAYLLSLLEYSRATYELIDLNILLFNDSSEQKKEFWREHKISEWLKALKFQKIFLSLNKQWERYVNKIIKINFRAVLFLVNSYNIYTVLKLTKAVLEKKPGAIVMYQVAAHFYEHKSQALLKQKPDLILLDEAVLRLKEITDFCKQGKEEFEKSIQALDGIAGVGSTYVLKLRESEPLWDYGLLPFPTYQKFNLKMYTETTLPLSLSYDYAFQSKGRALRAGEFKNTIEAEKIFKELAYYRGENFIRQFIFVDEIVNAYIPDLEKLCDLIIKAKLDISWLAGVEPDKTLQLSFLKKIKQAGCSALIVKLESGSPNILKRMHKNFVLKDAEKLLKDCKKAGIKTFLKLTIGFPGEGKLDFQKTVTFIKSNRRFIDNIYALDKYILSSDSDVAQNRQQFGIIYPEETRDYAIDWQDAKGSNDYLRSVRLYEITKMINKLGISIIHSNINYKEAKESKMSTTTELKENVLAEVMNEILDYKNKEIENMDKEKNTLVKQVNRANDKRIDKLSKEKEKEIKRIVAKNRKKFITLEKNLLKEKNKFQRYLNNIIKRKDKEVENLVSKHEVFLKDIVKNKNEEIKEIVTKAEKKEAATVAKKNEEIAELVRKHEEFVKKVVRQKDQETAKVAREYDLIIEEKDKEIKNLREEIEKIYQTKMFKMQNKFSKLLGK